MFPVKLGVAYDRCSNERGLMEKKMEAPIRIYLADLSHEGIRLATESFPYNIGLVASYAKKHLGNAVEFRLFKYVEALCNAVLENPPQILGCSNYVWNSNLSEWALGFAKRVNPEIITVQGGTNYPFHSEGQREFLRSRPSTDFYVYYEGEVAFLNLLQRFLDARNLKRMKEGPISGCQFLSLEGGALVSGQPVERLKRLDDIPSPYVTGLLDEFFDGKLTPMMETTRGCPFKCNFCNAGDDYFDKVNMFSLDYVIEEIMYIAPRIASVGVAKLIIADNNFGMYRRDAEICQALQRVKELYKWPMGIGVTTGKNNKDRIIKATEILGRSLLVNMSVQSMDETVLRNIKRDNIRIETYTQVNDILAKQGRSQNAEIIFPLPGETRESFMRGIETLMEAGADKITSYTLQMLHGTDYKDPEYRRRYGYQGKWRVIPYDFGEYRHERIFDVEEVAVQSKDVSFEDYLSVRSFAFITEAAYNDSIFREIVCYLRSHNVSPYVWLRAIWDLRNEFPLPIQTVFDSFIEETKRELWNSEEELIEFHSHPDNYARLVRGEIGGNVIYKHKSMLIAHHSQTWVDFITKVASNVIFQIPGVERTRVALELAEIQRYVGCKLSGVMRGPEEMEPVTAAFRYDILSWSMDAGGGDLANFALRESIEYIFYFDEQQRIELTNDFRLYGTSEIGLAKILARVPSHRRLIRNVRLAETFESSGSVQRMPRC